MNDPMLNLAFVLHNHQPVGNLEPVFRSAFDHAYEPFLSAVEEHPGVRVVLHYTGPLLEWIEREEPAFLDRLRALCHGNRVEILTGGLCEPILSMLPQRDRAGQIRRMTEWLEERLGVSPRGMWLAERVWEPHLARDIARAGVEYCLIDDSPFLKVGLAKEQLHGYYTTEEEGEILAIFPIDADLRAQVPFKLPGVTQAYLEAVAQQVPDGLALFADDGEKLGDWPGTHKWVYQQHYLSDLFETLLGKEPQVRFCTLSEFLDAHSPLGTAYVPAASYKEMEEWSGGFWRNFLRRYPESNQMHKKMLRVSAKVDAMPDTRPDKRTAQTHLYRGQCNCPYWHGVFGGIYLAHLRHANYAELLRAERIADMGSSCPCIREADVDCDRARELVFDGEQLVVVASPQRGGRITELSSKAEAHCLTATLSRYPEAYHGRWRDEAHEGGEIPLHYDWYPRQSLIDHFLGPGTTPKLFREAAYAEQGDFVDQPYGVEMVSDGPPVARLRRSGHVWEGGEQVPVEVSKTLRFDDAAQALAVEYCVTPSCSRPRRLWFGVEWNFALSAGDAFGRYYEIDGEVQGGPGLAASGQRKAARSIRLVDEWLRLAVDVSTSVPMEIWWQPLETVSQAVQQVDRLYQASTIVLSQRLATAPGGSSAFEVRVRVDSLADPARVHEVNQGDAVPSVE